MKTNLMPSATSAVVLSLLMLHPSPANAKNCKVRAADAYRAVIKKGWQFQCVTGSQTLPGALPFNRHGGLHVDYPAKGGISCFLNSLPSPVPPVASLRFFRNTSFTSTNGGLRNGWRLKPDWSLQRYRSVSGQLSPGQPPPVLQVQQRHESRLRAVHD